MTIEYWGLTEVAASLGIKPTSMARYPLPEPDAVIGKTRGWLPETIKAWQEQRPGRGNWERS